MFQFTVNCTGALRASNQMYSELQDKFVDLQDVAEDEKARADNEEKLKKDALEKAAQEENKKKNWRTVAISEGGIILTAIAFIVFL